MAGYGACKDWFMFRGDKACRLVQLSLQPLVLDIAATFSGGLCRSGIPRTGIDPHDPTSNNRVILARGAVLPSHNRNSLEPAGTNMGKDRRGRTMWKGACLGRPHLEPSWNSRC